MIGDSSSPPTGEPGAEQFQPGEGPQPGGGPQPGEGLRPGESPGQSAGQPQSSEEELRAAYEAEMARISSSDMILQATVSLLNIGGYRLGLSSAPDQPGGAARDLEQVRDAIDGVRALLPLLERRRPAGELRPLRDALSQLQLAYAREAAGAAGGEEGAGGGGQGGAGDDAGGGRQSGVGTAEPEKTHKAPPAPEPGAPPPAGQDEQAGGRRQRAPGPAESSGRLWVPGR